MASSKAFTLMEIVIVLIIVGVLVALMLPNYFSYIEQTNAQTAMNNLMAIEAAQEKHNEDNGGNGTYVLVAQANCNSFSLSALNLSTSTDDKFTYCCYSSTGETIGYNCTATDNNGTKLTLDPNLPAGTACAALTTAGTAPSCPIICTATNINYCPSSLQ